MLVGLPVGAADGAGVDAGADFLVAALGHGHALDPDVARRVLEALDPERPDNAGFLPDSPGVLGGIVLFVLVAVLTPIAEELFFRGYVQRRLLQRWSPAAARSVSTTCLCPKAAE